MISRNSASIQPGRGSLGFSYWLHDVFSTVSIVQWADEPPQETHESNQTRLQLMRLVMRDVLVTSDKVDEKVME